MRPNHDLSLESGERQVATDYNSIRADHRYRYEWADQHIPAGGFGLDVFCGNGYGTFLLAKTRYLLAVDGSAEAVQQADAHYRTPRSFFSQAYYPFELPPAAFDFAVSLESIEHVEDGQGFFDTLANSLKPGGVLVFSTPCQDFFPLDARNPFHFRHYHLEEILALPSRHSFDVIDWAGQNTYRMKADGTPGPVLDDSAMILKPHEAGQFVVVCCRKRQPL